MDVGTKFLIDLCNAFKNKRLENLIRYYAMLYLLDETGNGWVYSDWYISRTSEEFHVQPRQVKKQIALMAELQMIDIVKDRLYYRSQERVIKLLGGELTSNLAIKTKIGDLRNGVRARSHFQVGKLQALNKGETIMISRKNRQAVIHDPSPRTQRKYDKIQGVGRVRNIAILHEWKPGERIYDRNQDTGILQWRELIDGKYYVVRAISNLYSLGNLNKVGIRKRTRTFSNGVHRDPIPRIYYDELPKIETECYVFRKHVEVTGDLDLSCSYWDFMVPSAH